MNDTIAEAIAAELATFTSGLLTPPTARGYGADLICVDDIDPRGRETNPDELDELMQTAYHAVTTEKGTVLDDPDFGIDIRTKLHVGVTVAELRAAEGEARGELLKDDRIQDAVVSVVVQDEIFEVSMQIAPADPALRDFTLRFAVQDGAAMLKAFEAAR